MNRSFAIFCLIALLFGGLSYWQRGRLQALIPSAGASGGGESGGGGGGGGGKRKPLAPAVVEGIKVSGIVQSARPSAVLEAFGTMYTVMIGDQVMLPLTRGKAPEPVRCEQIEGLHVSLYFPSNDTHVKLQLSK